MHQHILYETPAAARNAVRGDLTIVACLSCGFVFNATFDLSLMSYGSGYENDQTHSPSFSEHVSRLVNRLLSESGVRNSRIVEVGCGKGDFLRALVASPKTGNVGWGFDPSYTGSDTDLEGRANFIRSFYTAAQVGIAPEVVVCRHVIEHVPDPAKLLTEIAVASHGARVFLETPDVEWILRNEVIWDFFYEHCSYFSPHSFTTALRRTGFASESISNVFDGQYLWVEATAGETLGKTTPSTSGEMVDLAASYRRGEHRAISTWSEKIDGLLRRGGVALWGAGAKGVTAAFLLDPLESRIRCVVDLNPAKQGRFVAATGHAIVSPRQLLDLGVRTVILMNPVYAEEVRQLLTDEAAQVEVVVSTVSSTAAVPS